MNWYSAKARRAGDSDPAAAAAASRGPAPGPPATALALRFLDRLFTVRKTAIFRKDSTL